MITPYNKHSYKVISLLIKTTIFILSIGYIIHKVSNSTALLYSNQIIQKINSPFFVIAFLLVALNWAIEAIKWKYLIRKLEKISFSTAFKSILSGVTISIFTPNRIGEFAGRIFYLKNNDKVKSTFISLTGSLFQLIVTVLTGTTAFLIYNNKNKNNPFVLNFTTFSNWILILFALVIVSILYVSYNQNSISERIKHILSLFNLREMLNIFILSLARYIVFSIQYYLMLRVFGINAGLIDSFLLIAITFFVTSAIPTFALTEIAVRASSSVLFFSNVTTDTSSIIAASFVLWIINLAIPALIGIGFVWNLNFFKD